MGQFMAAFVQVSCAAVLDEPPKNPETDVSEDYRLLEATRSWAARQLRRKVKFPHVYDISHLTVNGQAFGNYRT
jgi:hypothetical protein